MSKAFDKVIEKDSASLLIVDGLNMAFRWKHSKSAEFMEDFYNVIKSLQNSYKCAHIILLSDMGSSSYRKNIYPEYKGNRTTKYAEQTEKEAAEFKAFLEEFERSLNYCVEKKIPLLRYKNVEADDLAAYIVEATKEHNIDNIWLISSDKDWDLLVSERVNRFSYVTRKETTVGNWYEHYDCTPEQYISIKCLTGDAGDNIKGITGIGPKRAADLIKVYDNALDLYYTLPIPSKYKFMEALNQEKETILTNFLLMDLVTHCEEAIGKENIVSINNRLKEIFNV